ncbi:MAG: S9 family peptidase [Xanthomonadales bacterium]|nr:S9 family peptidase [Xanthomonadales bacterium]
MPRKLLTACAAIGLVTSHAMNDAHSKDHETGGAAAEAPVTLTIERLEASPGLDGPSARGVKIAPDGSRVTFLRGREDDRYQLDLWEYLPDTGEQRLLVDSTALLGAPEELDEVEKARRERQRIFFRGIIEYDFAPDGGALLFPLGGDLYYLPLGGEPRRLTETAATETDARVSPAGGYVSFIRDQNLHVVDLASGEERPLTTEGGGTVSLGMAEFVAQEEMYRFTGYWWSPDDRTVAYTRVDEERVSLVERYEIGADGVTTVPQRYPFAGEANAVVTLHLLDLATGTVTDVPFDASGDDYLVRVNWSPDGTLALQRQSRDQQRLDLVFVDPESGDQRVVLSERSDTWINLHSDLTFFEDGSRFLWTSERDGFRHLYLVGRDGTMISQLTRGDWALSETGRGGGAVRALVEAEGEVWVQGALETPLEQHLYRISLAGDVPPRRVTEPGGWHDTIVSPDGAFFIDRGEAPSRPPYTAIRDDEGALLSWVLENPLDAGHPYAPFVRNHVAPEYGTLPGADGTPLYYELLEPPGFDAGTPTPAIVYVYGGPGGASVHRRWSVDFRQYLARQGYVVFTVDNRGTGGRGTAFDDPIYRAMGGVEIEDQVAGARWLADRPGVDGNRIGIYGGSYGGYVTLLALMKAPEVFAAGVALAPVTDWRLYDTHYTERYMGDPSEGDAYTRSNPVTYVEGLEDPLLLVHGMADDNVFFDHSVKLMAALQQARKPFELMTYPGKRHRITGEDERVHLYRMMFDFFERHLAGEKAN